MSQLSPRTEQHAHWQQHIIHWQRSGQTQAAFCDAHDLVYHQFTYWRRKFAPNPDKLRHHANRVSWPCSGQITTPTPA